MQDGDGVVRVEAAYSLTPILGAERALEHYKRFATNAALTAPIRNAGTIGARKAGKIALPLLESLLGDPSHLVRARALESLRHMQEQGVDVSRVQAVAFKLVADKDPQVKKAALNLIETLAEKSVSSAEPAESPKSADKPYTSIFNGTDLNGWQGDAAVWTVKSNILTGHVPKGKPPLQYLVFTNTAVLGDFELRFSFRLQRGNAGVLYRAEFLEQGVVRGYEYSQLDSTFRGGETGVIHETGSGDPKARHLWGRSRLANIGEKNYTDPQGKVIRNGATEATPEQIRMKRYASDWQEGVITVRGNHLTHKLNGLIVAESTDLQPSRARVSGRLCLRVVGSMNDTLIEYKSIELKSY